MPAGRRTGRDERRRRLGQNFLQPQAAERFVIEAGVAPGELVVDIGAGSGALCHALLSRGAEVVAIELDPVWAARLRALARHEGRGRMSVVQTDVLTCRWPKRPFRVVACLLLRWAICWPRITSACGTAAFSEVTVTTNRCTQSAVRGRLGSSRHHGLGDGRAR